MPDFKFEKENKKSLIFSKALKVIVFFFYCMTLLATLAIIFGVLNGFANLPQIYKIFKTKSAKDISIITYLILTAGSIVWLLYGIEIMNIPVLTMNGLALFEFILVLIGCYMYGRR